MYAPTSAAAEEESFWEEVTHMLELDVLVTVMKKRNK